MVGTPLRGWLLAIGGSGVALALLALVAPAVPVPGPLRVVAALLAFVAVGAEVLLVGSQVPRLPARWLAAMLLPFGVLVAVALAGPSIPRVLAASLVTLGLLALGSIIGSVVGGAIDEPGYLLVVAIVSAMVDAFSVLHPEGPTAQLIEIEAAVNVLILPFPILGTTRIEPILGVGDVAFATIYFVASRRHGLSLRRTAVALALALIATMLTVMVTEVGVPALPFLGLAMVIAHPEARSVPREDRLKAVIGIAVIALVFGALSLLR